MRQKRIAAIHDISGLGKCALTVALPIVSVAGIECCAIPTALLSTHTGGFHDMYIKDLTDSILPIAKHWHKEGFAFDAIYSGYLGSMEQVDLLMAVIAKLKGKDTLVVVDPVMGDNGKLYQSFSPEFPLKMRELCRAADVITPNITEACLLLGRPYREPPYSKAYVEELLNGLAELCGGTVVLTGAVQTLEEQGAAAYAPEAGQTYFAAGPRVPGMYHGTGDVFASVLVSALVLGRDLQTALRAAVDFTCHAIEASAPYRDENWYGVNFEAVLPKLPQMLKGELP